jgi:hypothetical protein
MGLIWAVGGVGIGGLFELIDNVAPGALPFISRVDMWPQTLAIPFFIAGLVFGAVLAIVGSRRRFDELSIPRFTAWGAVAGLLLGGIAVLLGIKAPVLAVGILTLGSAVSAAASLTLARVAERRELLSSGGSVGDETLTDGQARQLLRRGD